MSSKRTLNDIPTHTNQRLLWSRDNPSMQVGFSPLIHRSSELIQAR